MCRWGAAIGFFMLSLAPVQAAVPDACVEKTSQEPLLRPIIETHQIPPYPNVSQKLGEYGVTTMQVLVDKFGVPIDVTILKGSGSPRLDDAAVAKVRDDWRWEALEGPCRESGIIGRVMIVWNLIDSSTPLERRMEPMILYATGSDYPESARNQKEEGVATVDFYLTDKGGITGAYLVASSGFDDLDAAAMQMVLRQKFQPAQINGKPTISLTGLQIAFLLKGPASQTFHPPEP